MLREYSCATVPFVDAKMHVTKATRIASLLFIMESYPTSEFE